MTNLEETGTITDAWGTTLRVAAAEDRHISLVIDPQTGERDYEVILPPEQVIGLCLSAMRATGMTSQELRERAVKKGLYKPPTKESRQARRSRERNERKNPHATRNR